VELCILAEHYRAEISVTDVQTGRADVYGQGRGFTHRCFLVFTGIHFDAVGFDQVRLGEMGHACAFDGTWRAEPCTPRQLFFVFVNWPKFLCKAEVTMAIIADGGQLVPALVLVARVFR
jgi:hypothetical protein